MIFTFSTFDRRHWLTLVNWILENQLRFDSITLYIFVPEFEPFVRLCFGTNVRRWSLKFKFNQIAKICFVTKVKKIARNNSIIPVSKSKFNYPQTHESHSKWNYILAYGLSKESGFPFRWIRCQNHELFSLLPIFRFVYNVLLIENNCYFRF